MKSIRTILIPLFCGLFVAGMAQAQSGPQTASGQEWPRSFTTDDGTVIKIFQPQPESFSDNVLKSRWAISVLQNGKQDPVFGTFWSVANVETDRDNRRVIIQSVKVPNVKFPGQTDENFTINLKTVLESNLPQVAGDLSLDEILASLDQNMEEKKLSKDLNTAAPRIIYTNQPSILVQMDGQPKLQPNQEWGLDVVVNSPFTIVRPANGSFYLYGGKHWYSAQSATGPYSPAGNIPGSLQVVQNSVDQANSANAGYVDSAGAAQDNSISNIIVSTSPAELIQTSGPASWSPIAGTNLSYASNSPNDIFQDQGSGQYYVLISGRWYNSGTLNGGWHYVASNALPPDFARIPEGSPKDNVLASVAGTEASREAVMDAQIPQTAKVDRNSATADVQYNGEPQFAPVQGTDMQYATNSPNNVIQDRGKYYTVDNGVWFEGNTPNGPWSVATERPEDVDQIPPTSPLYNTKYVYIYDVTPDYVYTGYTPGYLNTYVYGGTVVYGTGYYYNPWWGGYYYPRPWTWGFNVCYNPWIGWGLGYGFGSGWFHFGLGWGWHSHWGAWAGGGWWGPHIYHPPYMWAGSRAYGFYGNNFYRNRNVYVNNYHVNIYNGRSGVVTRNNITYNNRNFNNRPTINGTRPGSGFNNGRSYSNNRPTTVQGGRPGTVYNRPGGNNVYSDRNGNVYQRNATTNQWQQRQSNNQWRSVSPGTSNTATIQNLNRQQQMRSRGQMNTENFQRARTFSAPARSGGGYSAPRSGGSSAPRSSGGGGRSYSGGGGGSRGSSGGSGNHGGRH
jgi:hypothetical protein